MGTTLLIDAALSEVKVAVDLSRLQIEGAVRSRETSQVDIDFGGACIPRGLTVRFEPQDPQVNSTLRAWDASGHLDYGTLSEAIEQDRLGKGTVVFGEIVLPPIHVERR